MSRTLLRCEVADGVATLTLDNPPLNLVSVELTGLMLERLAELAERRDVRVLVVTGAGERAFCAGSDVTEFPGLYKPGEAVSKKLGAENTAFSAVDDFPKPTIAALNGLAFGGGLELAVCCDLLVADERARLALPEIRLGIFPGSGGTVRVTRRIGEGRAKEMMYFGDPIDAETALRWGLVNRIVPAGQALQVAQDMAKRLAQGPPNGLRLCKTAVDLSFDVTEDEAIRRSLELIGEAFALPDCQEGVSAFLNKRPARFQDL
jgi:enoyl-CoA hydratase